MKISWLGISAVLCLLMSTIMAEEDVTPPASERLVLNSVAELPPRHLRGLWVVIGVTDTALMKQIVEVSDGQALVQGLSVDPAVTATLRQELAEAGLHPLVTVQTLPDVNHLPFVDHLASVVVVDEASGVVVPDSELDRILFHNRPLIRGSGNSWVAEIAPMPQDVGEWTHGVINPQRSPISTDGRLGPWVNGIRWMIGDQDVSRRAGSRGKDPYRSGGGGVLGVRLVDGVAVAVSSLGKRSGTYIRALDAANGLPLWAHKIESSAQGFGGSGFFIASDLFVATREGVFGYFGQGGPLIRLDLHTGKELQRYEEGISFKSFQEKRNFKTVNTQTLTVNVFDGKILQSYDKELVLLDLNSGKRLWAFSEEESFLISPCLGDDGRVYAGLTAAIDSREHDMKAGNEIPVPKAIICLDPESGEVIWRTPFDWVGFEGISGPQGGFLPLVGNDGNGKTKPGWNNSTMMIETETGKILWKVKGGGGARGYAFMRNGEVVVTGALSSVQFLDPLTGKVIRNLNYGGNSGGCGFETFTADYLVRGQMLHPIDNLEKTYASAGMRPGCQVPMFTGYGRVYSPQSRCGCGFYLPMTYASMAHIHQQPRVPIDQRVQQVPFPSQMASAFSNAVPDNDLTEIWPAVKDSLDTGKSTRFSDVDQDISKTIGTKIGAGTNQGRTAKGFWYGRFAEDLVVGDLTVRVDPHRHVVTGLRGEVVVWSTVVGGRVGSKPVAHDGAIYMGAHDGYVYKLLAEDGSVAWRVMIAPNHQQMMAFGQLESVWPCFGVLLEDGKLYSTAGRSSTLDQGIFAAQIDLQSGELAWHVRMSAESMEFATPKDLIGNAGGGRTSPAGWGVKRGAWPGQPFSRARMSVNAPPMITNNKLHVNGAIYVDLTNPADSLYFNNEGEIIGSK